MITITFTRAAATNGVPIQKVVQACNLMWIRRHRLVEITIAFLKQSTDSIVTNSIINDVRMP